MTAAPFSRIARTQNLPGNLAHSSSFSNSLPISSTEARLFRNRCQLVPPWNYENAPTQSICM